MPKLYVITGPAGVGKSTISNELAQNLNKSALIEGDEIYHQVVGGYTPAWKEGNHLETFWKVCINTIKTYLQDGYDVVFNYIINPKTLNLLKNSFKDIELKFVLLMVDEETLLYRDSFRDEDCQMKERCIVLLNNFRNKNFDEKFILDTSKLSVADVVDTFKNDEKFIV